MIAHQLRLATMLLAGASSLAVASPAAAATRILYASGGTAERNAPLPPGPLTLSGGTTQLIDDAGNTVSIVGDADVVVAPDGGLTIARGNFTAVASGEAPLTITGPNGQRVVLTGAGHAGSFAMTDGNLSGRVLEGRADVTSGGSTKTFGTSYAFNAASGQAPDARVTVGAQVVSAGPVTFVSPDGLPTETAASTALNPTGFSTTGLQVTDNPVLGTVPAGTVADLLRQVVTASAFRPAGTDAALAAQLAFLNAGGTPGGLDAAAAATALGFYLAYLNAGGAAADYRIATPQLLVAYADLLRAVGIPMTSSAATRAAIQSFLDYLAQGGAIGSFPVAAAPAPSPAPTPTPTPTPTPAPAPTPTPAPTPSTSGSYAVTGLSDPGIFTIGFDSSNKPVDFGQLGKLGTAKVVDYNASTSWSIGRIAGGTFERGGTTASYGANEGVHFTLMRPLTNLPTSGGVIYSTVAATLPTLVGANAPAGTGFSNAITLGVAFGSRITFGFEGAYSLTTADGQTNSATFSSAGGPYAPSLTSVDNRSPLLALYGTAPLTAVSGPLCATISACRMIATFAVGNDKATQAGVTWTLLNASNAAVVTGAAIVQQNGVFTPSAPMTTAFADVPGSRTSNQFLVRIDPRGSNIASVGPVTTVVDGSGLAAYRRESASAESPQRGTAKAQGGSADNGAIGWTRWYDGTTAGDYNGSSPVELTANQGWHFVYGPTLSAMPTSGTGSYALVGATAPTIANGSVQPGSLSGSAAVAFGTTPKVGLDFTVAMGGASYRTTTSGGVATPIDSTLSVASNGRFEGGNLTVAGSGAGCPTGTCKGYVIGTLGGSGATYLGLTYLLSESGSGANAVAIGGAAAFSRTSLTAAPSAPTGSSNITFQAPNENRAVFTGNVQATSDGRLAVADTSAQFVSRGSATDSENGGLAGVIGWTRWTNGSYSTESVQRTLTANQGLHAVWGTPATNLPTSGTATYTLAGSTKPTNEAGSAAPGSFSGSLAVSFAAMKVGWESTVAFGGTNYVFNTSGGLAAPSVTLQSNGTWIGSAGPASGSGPGGRAYGFLAGPGGSHAGMTYFIETGTNVGRITGTAVFTKN